MKMPGWWEQRSGYAKTVAALAVLLVLQIGICAVLPAEGGFPVGGGVLFVVFIGTFVLFIAALLAWLVSSLLS
jgi:hypothetical protein